VAVCRLEPTRASVTRQGLGWGRGRDRTQNANNIANKLKQDVKEKDMLIDVLTLFDSKQKKCSDAVNKLKNTRPVGCLRAATAVPMDEAEPADANAWQLSHIKRMPTDCAVQF
jgi:hypothetical protein